MTDTPDDLRPGHAHRGALREHHSDHAAGYGHGVANGRQVTEPDDGLDLASILQMLRRRWLVIASLFVVVTGIATVRVFQQTPIYQAEAVLMIDPRRTQVTDVESVLAGLPTEAAALRSQLDILQSPPLLGRVVERLNLYQHPALNTPPEPGPWQRLTQWLGDLVGLDDGSEAGTLQTPPPDKETRRRQLVNQLRGALQPVYRGDSYTIRLRYSSPNASFAAEVVNAVADQYLVDQLEAKFEATRRANAWLSDRLEDLRAEVYAAELAVRDFRERNNIVQSGSSTVTDQQLAQFNSQLVTAQVELSQAESRLRAAKAGNPSVLRDVAGTTMLSELRSEAAELRSRQAELATRYGPRHPEMINIQSERQELEEKLDEETGRVIESLENEVVVARTKVNALQRAMDELRTSTQRAGRAEVELNELERNAESARVLYENFLARFKETRTQDELETPDARILSEAQVPNVPASPNKQRAVMGGGAVGLMLGLLAAFGLERLDRGYRRSLQIERETGLPVLSVEPLVKGSMQPSEYVVAKPFSSYAESQRTLRTALQFVDVDEPPKVVMVTSSVPQEGKTTLSLSLARASAMAGAKVLLVEADMRRPELSKAVGVEPSGVLKEVLAGSKRADEAIFKDPKTSAHLVFAGSGVASSAELLGSKRMAAFLQVARQRYDLVIVDTPPVLAVSDASAMAKSVDTTVFVVRWAETPRDTIKTALHQLELVGAAVAGIALTQVDPERQASYGYGEYGYYYSRYGEYYTDRAEPRVEATS